LNNSGLPQSGKGHGEMSIPYEIFNANTRKFYFPVDTILEKDLIFMYEAQDYK